MTDLETAGAFALLGELVPQAPETDATRAMEEQIGATLAGCIELDASGRPRLTITPCRLAVRLPAVGTRRLEDISGRRIRAG